MRTFSIATFPFDRSAAEPFYQQIYDGVRASIVTGRLRPGERLPSTRGLAAELGISRLPVVYAFDQLLHEGYIVGRAGSGSYVNESIPDELAEVGASSSVSPRPQAGRPARSTDGYRLGALRVSLPALDSFPLRLWSRLVAKNVRALTPQQMAYGDPAGYAPLRVAIADYLRTARAVQCDADQVLIVSGSQMALQISASTLLGSGRVACMEEPGYAGARDALTRSGARIVPVRVDDQGIDVAALGRQRRARVVYVTPSHQYPLGVSMAASRRLELLEWARRAGAWILEDDYDSEYRYASRPLGSLQGTDAAARVIYFGTFSKVLFPSLRIGYVVVPHELIDAFIKAREAIDLFSPVLDQIVLTEFLVEGHFSRHLRRMRALYQIRRDALVRHLREHADLHAHNCEAGLHISTFLPEGIDDHEVVKKAASAGIDVLPLSDCYAGSNRRTGLVIGFGGGSEHQISAACRKLGEIVKSVRS